MLRNVPMIAILMAFAFSIGTGGGSDAAGVPKSSVPRGFTCLGTAFPEEVYTAPIPKGWVEKTIEEVVPGPTGAARNINTRMPGLTAADQKRGYVIFVRNWGDDVFPQTAPLPAEMKNSAEIFASPGEYEPASFCVRALRPLSKVRVTVEDLARKRGSRIGRQNVDVRIVRCLPTKVWDKKEYVIRPRILEKHDVVDIASDTTQQFWLTVYVPENAKPGNYSARVTVRPQNAKAAFLTLGLEVLPIRLKPSPARHYMYAYMFGNPLEHEIVVKNLVNMREHGMTGGYFAVDFAPKVKRENGRIIVDAEPLKGLLKDCQGIGLVDPFIYMPMGVDAWGENGYVDGVKEIVKQVKEAGLLVPILTVGDEDDGDPVRTAGTTRYLRLIKENLPGVRTYTTVVSTSSVDVFDPWLDFRAFSSYADGTTAEAMKKKGKELWMYSGSSTYGMDPVCDRFYRGFYARRMNLNAAGQWVYQWPLVYRAEPNDPCRDFTEARPHGNNWDYCLPGPDGPLPTPGWEGFREGIDDSRYIATLESAISQAEGSKNTSVREAARAARAYLDTFLSPIDLSPSSPAVFPVRREAAKFTNSELDGCRREIANLILRLQKEISKSEGSGGAT